MRLGAKGILDARKAGDIYIRPYHEESLQPNSYDVAIDGVYYRQRNVAGRVYLHDYIKADTELGEKFWEGPIYSSQIAIAPNSMVLATTVEYIGAVNGYTTLLKTKSTLERLMIQVSAGAGFGDVGFVNKWTLEIVNHSNFEIIIPMGMKVGQIAFDKVEGQGHRYSGSYVQQPQWTPEQMLPKLKPSIILPGFYSKFGDKVVESV